MLDTAFNHDHTARCGGNLLTGTLPAETGWFGFGKDHLVFCPARMEAFAIGIHDVPLALALRLLGLHDVGLWHRLVTSLQRPRLIVGPR